MSSGTAIFQHLTANLGGSNFAKAPQFSVIIERRPDERIHSRYIIILGNYIQSYTFLISSRLKELGVCAAENQSTVRCNSGG